MDALLLDLANLLLRWLHVVVAIAWIGSSFYFVWLDNHLTRPQDPELLARGVDGELWAVHGGGFYNPQKYLVGPKRLPEHLHWFYWESYSTWLSGFALFVAVYLLNARAFLIDARVFDWAALAGPQAAPWVAGAAALAFLAAGWLVYDTICRLFGRNADGSIGGDARVGAGVVLFVVVAAWLACHLFAGRAAFLITGAMIATIMSANVFFWIIPGQRTVVADLRAGRRPDPIHGQRGKQRSVHNTYFTLPVLFAMLSNHYGALYGHRLNWVLLVLLMLAGAAVRQFFVQRHKGSPNWGYAIASALLVVGAGAVAHSAAPGAGDGALAQAGAAGPGVASGAAAAGAPGAAHAAFVEVHRIVEQRCVLCHNAAMASKNVRLDSPEAIAAQAQQVYQQAVVSRTMPLNNATSITDAERAALGRWFEAGAQVN